MGTRQRRSGGWLCWPRLEAGEASKGLRTSGLECQNGELVLQAVGDGERSLASCVEDGVGGLAKSPVWAWCWDREYEPERGWRLTESKIPGLWP